MTERGVSIAINYVLGIAIAMVLLTGLLFGTAQFVSSQNDQVSREEMRVVGQRIAAEIQQADRLVTAGGPSPTVSLEVDVPDRITGSPYTVQTVERSSPTRHFVTVNSSQTDSSAAVRVPTSTDVRDGASATGGALTIEFDTGSAELVISDG
jgi:hypothetical protein